MFSLCCLDGATNSVGASPKLFFIRRRRRWSAILFQTDCTPEDGGGELLFLTVTKHASLEEQGVFFLGRRKLFFFYLSFPSPGKKPSSPPLTLSPGTIARPNERGGSLFTSPKVISATFFVCPVSFFFFWCTPPQSPSLFYYSDLSSLFFFTSAFVPRKKRSGEAGSTSSVGSTMAAD